MVSLRTKGRANRKAAYAAWHHLKVEGVTAKAKAPATVAEVVAAFLSDAEGRVKRETLRTYRMFLLPFKRRFGRMRADELTPPQCEAAARKPTWGDSSRSGFLSAVVSAFRWAVRASVLTAYPLAGLKKPPKASRSASALITAGEHRRLLDSASTQFCLFLRVLWATGARPSEVARLAAADVDWTMGIARLAEHKTARLGHRRTIYLPPDIVDLLRRLAVKRPAGPLLRNRDGRIWTCWNIRKAMAAARRRAGVPNATAYGYRHTFATDALERGVPDAHVAELLGHSGTAMLHKHYAHLSARSAVLRSALDRIR
jgi:integrase